MEHATDRDPRATRQESAERVRQAAATGEISQRSAMDQLSVIERERPSQSPVEPSEPDRAALRARMARILARERMALLRDEPTRNSKRESNR